MAQFVDWDLAAATAAALGKSGPAVSYEEAADAVADLKGLADEAVEHVTAFTGMQAQVIAPPVRVVDRRDWAATNIDGLRQVINPLAERLTAGNTPGPLTAAIGSRFTGVQAGTVLAYLSGKVLGQYEVFTANPGQLLLVAPNIVEAERRLGADPRDFRLWVCLHEVTHRVQFTGVAWMRGYFLGEVQAFVDASQLNQDQLFERVRRGVTALADAIRDPESRVSVLDLVQTPGQRAVLDRLTALMTLLEGHAEFVMDGVGPEVVPSVEDIRAKFNRRRETANPIERVIRKLLGIEAKMRQYGEGRKFVHGVVERVGMAGFNRIWDSPLTLPRLDELADPDAWVNRVHGPDAYRQLGRPSTTPAPAAGAAPSAATAGAAASAATAVADSAPAGISGVGSAVDSSDLTPDAGAVSGVAPDDAGAVSDVAPDDEVVPTEGAAAAGGGYLPEIAVPADSEDAVAPAGAEAAGTEAAGAQAAAVGTEAAAEADAVAGTDAAGTETAGADAAVGTEAAAGADAPAGADASVGADRVVTNGAGGHGVPQAPAGEPTVQRNGSGGETGPHLNNPETD